MIDTATLNEEELLLFIELRRLAQRASATSRECLQRSSLRPKVEGAGEQHECADERSRWR
jgi:hypothetical protein